MFRLKLIYNVFATVENWSSRGPLKGSDGSTTHMGWFLTVIVCRYWLVEIGRVGVRVGGIRKGGMKKIAMTEPGATR